MKVYDQTLTSAASSGATATRETQRNGRAETERPGGNNSAAGDRIEFSGALSSLSRALSAFGADRSSRVQALAAQYQAGTYQPDASATSRGMVAEALTAGAQ